MGDRLTMQGVFRGRLRRRHLDVAWMPYVSRNVQAPMRATGGRAHNRLSPAEQGAGERCRAGPDE